MSQAFDTVNHYTLIEKLINTNTPNLITRFIANYIRGRKAFTLYKNKNSFKKQFKAGVPQGGVLSPTLFNIYMSDLPTPPRDIHVTTYADDITIYSSDKNYTIAQQRLQPYLEDVQTWTKANDLKLNTSKTMTTLFTPDPAEYRDELSLQLDNTRLPTIRNPKILGLTFDPKLTFNEHIKTSKDKAEKTINILKALTSTHWGKNKETLTNTYKTVTRPILEYAGTIYAPIISDKQLTALQVTQNQGLRIATGCTSDTNINHIHDETKILPIEKHLRLHSSQLRQKASHPDHPLHRLTTQPQPPRLKKKTIFNNNQYTLNIDPDPTHAIDENTIKQNMKTIHTTIVQDHLSNRPINKLLNRPPPDIDKKEETLPHSTRRKLSQLRTNKSPLLMTYLHKIDPANHPAANCPLCNDPNHDSLHLFNCPDIPTTLTVWDLWTDPVGVAALLDVWGRSWAGPERGSEILCVLTHGMGSTPPPQLKDRKRSKDLIFMLGLSEAIDLLVMASSVHWYGHVLRIEDGQVLTRALHFGVEVQRKKGRPNRTWKKLVEEESVKVGLRREDALCRSMWSVGVNQIAAGLMWIRLSSLVIILSCWGYCQILNIGLPFSLYTIHVWLFNTCFGVWLFQLSPCLWSHCLVSWSTV